MGHPKTLHQHKNLFLDAVKIRILSTWHTITNFAILNSKRSFEKKGSNLFYRQCHRHPQGKEKSHNRNHRNNANWWRLRQFNFKTRDKRIVCLSQASVDQVWLGESLDLH